MKGRHLDIHPQLSLDSTYTDLYAPCVEEEDEELVAVNMTSLLDTEMEEMNKDLSESENTSTRTRGGFNGA
ncbi:hypothetical protein CesoFtcFv8_010544 [Champsocephalus esox]|uniref:Uncharacterized protein n=1 Tax=Champsocephalus esox TaxID=159716 RepID=A0AAN8C5T2_9TELE|nr:hypothetical protein CesoFtcFv8_010544 [Champsocephalus esox]